MQTLETPHDEIYKAFRYLKKSSLHVIYVFFLFCLWPEELLMVLNFILWVSVRKYAAHAGRVQSPVLGLSRHCCADQCPSRGLLPGN